VVRFILSLADVTQDCVLLRNNGESNPQFAPHLIFALFVLVEQIDTHFVGIFFVGPLDPHEVLEIVLGVGHDLGALPHVFLVCECAHLSEIQLDLPYQLIRGQEVFVEQLQPQRVFLLHVVDGLVPNLAVVPIRAAVAAEPVRVRTLVFQHCLLLLVHLLHPALDVCVSGAPHVSSRHFLCIPNHQSNLEFARGDRIDFDQGLLVQHVRFIEFDDLHVFAFDVLAFDAFIAFFANFNCVSVECDFLHACVGVSAGHHLAGCARHLFRPAFGTFL